MSVLEVEIRAGDGVNRIDVDVSVHGRDAVVSVYRDEYVSRELVDEIHSFSLEDFFYRGGADAFYELGEVDAYEAASQMAEDVNEEVTRQFAEYSDEDGVVADVLDQLEVLAAEDDWKFLADVEHVSIEWEGAYSKFDADYFYSNWEDNHESH